MTTVAERPVAARSILPVPLLVAGLAVLAVVIVRNAWVAEDAYITFRTIDNFMHGYGLRWNVDERVQTYTHPLWMLLIAVLYRFTAEPYYTSLALSIVLSLATAVIIVNVIATDRHAASLVIAALIFSKAFIDYATSGLENPLTNVLLAVFFALYFRARRGVRRAGWLAFVAGLLVMTRHDNVLIVLPALGAAMWTDRGRRTLPVVIVALLPLIAWESFSVIYYGFPFPNTAYAKLQTAIPTADLLKQGFEYLADSLTSDPLTLTAIGSVSIACLAFRRRPEWFIVAGIALHFAYVLRAGGDFMSGRFLVAPFVCAMIAASRFDGLFDDLSMGLASAAIVLLGLTGDYPTVLSASVVDGGWVEPSGIADERRYHYPISGLLRLPSDGPWPDLRSDVGREALARGERTVGFSNIGRVGFAVGPSLHIIDNWALSDPLLARLPAAADWRIGHYRREMPDGYERTIESGVNHIADPAIAALYDDLWRVTAGPIWDRERWRAIVRLNLGSPSRALRNAPSPLPTLIPNFTSSPDPCTLSGSSATVDCVVDGTRSDAKRSIVSYVWSYLGTATGNNVRTTLQLTCANTGTERTATIPVTLTVRDDEGREQSVTRPVNVVKVGACGY
jgi:arabinofuranosyltransferase